MDTAHSFVGHGNSKLDDVSLIMCLTLNGIKLLKLYIMTQNIYFHAL